MLIVILNFFKLVLAVTGGIFLIGYMIYRVNELDSWEQGIRKLPGYIVKIAVFLFDFFYEGFSGNVPLKKVIDTSHICRNDEALELVSRLTEHPYDTPSLVCYEANINGISWYDISAMGLISKYDGLTNEQIGMMCYKIIQNYFMKTRGKQIPIFIKVATHSRLYFAVALSEESRQFLEKQQNDVMESGEKCSTSQLSKKLEETIDLFPHDHSKDVL